MKNLSNSPAIQKILAGIKINQKQGILLTLIFLLILAGIDYQFVISGQLRGIAEQGPKIVRLKKDIIALGRDLVKYQSDLNSQAEMQEKLLLNTKTIITEEQKANLLQEVSDLANKDEVKIIQIKFSSEPQGSSRQEASAAKNKKTNSSVAANEKFSSLSISLDLTADYHHLGRFINDLEDGQYYIGIEGFKIISKQDNYLRQEASLVLKTYVRK